jgi:hypothetical protein
MIIFLGMVRFVWQLSYKDSPCDSLEPQEKRPLLLEKVHYLHFALILFFITLISTWVISIMVISKLYFITNKS